MERWPAEVVFDSVDRRRGDVSVTNTGVEIVLVGRFLGLTGPQELVIRFEEIVACYPAGLADRLKTGTLLHGGFHLMTLKHRTLLISVAGAAEMRAQILDGMKVH